MLLAEEFPWSVTSTVVWLNEMGLDLTLMRYQAYRTGAGEIVLTVSQLYPVREVADFEVAPHKRSTRPRWWEMHLRSRGRKRISSRSLRSPTRQPLRSSTYVRQHRISGSGVADVYEHAGVAMASGTGQLGEFWPHDSKPIRPQKTHPTSGSGEPMAKRIIASARNSQRSGLSYEKGALPLTDITDLA